MRNHTVGLDVSFFVRSFVYFHTSCVRTAKAQTGETAWMRRLTWAFPGRLCDKYHNLMSLLKYLSPKIIFHCRNMKIDICKIKWVEKGYLGFLSSMNDCNGVSDCYWDCFFPVWMIVIVCGSDCYWDCFFPVWMIVIVCGSDCYWDCFFPVWMIVIVGGSDCYWDCFFPVWMIVIVGGSDCYWDCFFPLRMIVTVGGSDCYWDCFLPVWMIVTVGVSNCYWDCFFPVWMIVIVGVSDCYWDCFFPVWMIVTVGVSDCYWDCFFPVWMIVIVGGSDSYWDCRSGAWVAHRRPMKMLLLIELKRVTQFFMVSGSEHTWFWMEGLWFWIMLKEWFFLKLLFSVNAIIILSGIV